MFTPRSRRWLFLFGITTLIVPAQPVFSGEDGESEAYVVEVREEWEVSIGEPNLDRNAPQVTMIMSPYGDLSRDYFAFVLNMKTVPEYSPGGMQVLRYRGDEVVGYQNGYREGMLRNEGEAVRWRQTLSVENGVVTFRVDQGTSQTWGTFGNYGYLYASLEDGPDNLNNYRPQLSLQESGIGFAGNRVESLTLTRLEWHLSDGQVVTFTAPIDIDSDLDPWDD